MCSIASAISIMYIVATIVQVVDSECVQTGLTEKFPHCRNCTTIECTSCYFMYTLRHGACAACDLKCWSTRRPACDESGPGKCDTGCMTAAHFLDPETHTCRVCAIKFPHCKGCSTTECYLCLPGYTKQNGRCVASGSTVTPPTTTTGPTLKSTITPVTGSTTSTSVLSTTTSPDPGFVEYLVLIRISNRHFTTSLHNNNSTEFRDLSNRLTPLLENAYRISFGEISYRINDMKFAPGSISVEHRLLTAERLYSDTINNTATQVKQILAAQNFDVDNFTMILVNQPTTSSSLTGSSTDSGTIAAAVVCSILALIIIAAVVILIVLWKTDRLHCDCLTEKVATTDKPPPAATKQSQLHTYNAKSLTGGRRNPYPLVFSDAIDRGVSSAYKPAVRPADTDDDQAGYVRRYKNGSLVDGNESFSAMYEDFVSNPLAIQNPHFDPWSRNRRNEAARQREADQKASDDSARRGLGTPNADVKDSNTHYNPYLSPDERGRELEADRETKETAENAYEREEPVADSLSEQGETENADKDYTDPRLDDRLASDDDTEDDVSEPGDDEEESSEADDRATNQATDAAEGDVPVADGSSIIAALIRKYPNTSGLETVKFDPTLAQTEFVDIDLGHDTVVADDDTTV